MDIIKDANEWLGASMSNMSTSDRVHSSRRAKELILGINEVYKERSRNDLKELEYKRSYFYNNPDKVKYSLSGFFMRLIIAFSFIQNRY